MENSSRKQISKMMRVSVWNYRIGQNIGKIKCLCCNTNDIFQHTFECGHVISVKNRGLTNLDNLLPICSTCNKSMSTMDMGTFSQTLRRNIKI